MSYLLKYQKLNSANQNFPSLTVKNFKYLMKLKNKNLEI